MYLYVPFPNVFLFCRHALLASSKSYEFHLDYDEVLSLSTWISVIMLYCTIARKLNYCFYSIHVERPWELKD